MNNTQSKDRQRGHIEVICGCMFSGKTEELIRRLKRAELAKQSVKTYKPAIDTRYEQDKMVSHDANFMASKSVSDSRDILSDAGKASVVGIDEAQFFDQELVEVCNQLADKGTRVIVAGLDMDYLGNPFGPIPKLLSVAQDITKLQAVCVRCGNAAHYSHRTVKDNHLVLVGEKDHYEALCRNCYNSVKS